MDAHLKAKWVEALRSGEYKQARLMLEDDGRFCCLGVLCKVAGLDTGDSGPTYRRLDKITGGYGQLVTLNDDQMKSFKQIARWIEVNL